MGKSSQKRARTRNAGNRVHYFRPEVESTGGLKGGEPLLEQVFNPGEAFVIKPEPGIILRGTLIDCPETEAGTGTIVLDTGDAIVALQSATFTELTIENSPCVLEVIAVRIKNKRSGCRTDWEAYELSPNGTRVLVSEPHTVSSDESA